MLRPTLNRRVEEALHALDLAAPLMGVLESLDAVNAQVDTNLLGIAEGGGNKISEKAGVIHTQLSSLPSITRSLSARKLFREIEVLEQRLSTALGAGLDDPKYIVEFVRQLDKFADAYNVYVAHQTGANALPLLQISRSLRSALAQLRGFLEYFRSNSLEQPMRPDEAEFSLVLANVSGLQDFASKLMALEALYLELCYMLGVSAASHPLRIAKVESGSLWTRLFGDTRVVGLMISLVEGSVHFFHRNYTTEGKIAAIPKRIESLDAILNFSNRLKESGVNVAELQDSLAKSAVGITNSLNTLVADQPLIEINGRTLSVGDEVQRVLLERAATPKIEYSAPTTEVPKLNPPAAD